MNVWVYTSEVTAKRIRERYLRAILRQDIAFFDKVGAGEVTTRIQTDTRTCSCRFLSHIEVPTAYVIDLVQQGISEKVPIVVGFFSAFVTGFVLAYVRTWRLALAMSSILPSIAISGGLMNKFVIKYTQYVCSRTFRFAVSSFNLGSRSSMLPRAGPMRRKSYLQSVRLRLLVPRTCLRLCTMWPLRRPTMQIAEVRWLKGWVCPLSSFPCMLRMLLVSSAPWYSHELTHFYAHIPSVQLWDHAH